jgi:hypothetical protein
MSAANEKAAGSEPHSSISNTPVEKPPVRQHSGFLGRRKSPAIVNDEKKPTDAPEAGSQDLSPVSLSAMFRCV